MTLTTFLKLLLTIFLHVNSNYASEDESRLLRTLLGQYQIYERPVADESKAVELEFGISLRQIIDLDERNQLLKSNLWLEYTWQDLNLQWNQVRLFLSENTIKEGQCFEIIS